MGSSVLPLDRLRQLHEANKASKSRELKRRAHEPGEQQFEANGSARATHYIGYHGELDTVSTGCIQLGEEVRIIMD